MNSAYRSSLFRTASSIRTCNVAVFGFVGGGLTSDNDYPPLSMRSCLQSCMRRRMQLCKQNSYARAKHELRFSAARGGSDPRSPQGPGREFAARWGRSRLCSCFGRVVFTLPPFVHPLVLSAAYGSAWVTGWVKSPGRTGLLALFQGVFTKELG